ncbi:MAG TPA: LysE family translocator [Steroidobacteraceae bacterium]|jgi:threonine/homoserine/homoserine lactone efflux protein|nr:LysE family translocator [Steroidobacteraceae bacterium]
MQTFPWALILASVPFMISMGITPGPNNILVASSGVNFGFRASLPHILGITIGYPLMLLIVGIGLAKIFIAVPLFHTVLKYISIAYLLYLAVRLALASAMGEGRRTTKPMTFLQAAAFQWVNGKAWVISLGAVTTYTVVDATLPLQIAALTAIAVVVTLACVCCWTYFGALMRQFLNTERRRRAFNYAMAGLLVLSIVPVLFE